MRFRSAALFEEPNRFDYISFSNGGNNEKIDAVLSFGIGCGAVCSPGL